MHTFEFQEHQFESIPFTLNKPLAETPFYCINISEDLLKLVQLLEEVNEFALEPIINTADKPLDVLALSTKSADFLLDLITLKNDIWRLGPVLGNPNIVKVLSNGSSVLQKLQNYFSFYAVNVFDLNKAILFLHKTKVKCAHTVLKLIYSTKIQPIDEMTTVRPFTLPFLAQCRIRSHYLIQSYYYYKHQFLQCEHSFYVKFLENCRDACKYVYSEDSEEALLIEELKVQQDAELTLLRKLHLWRLKTARTTAKPVTEVLTNSELLNISCALPFDLSFLNAVTDTPVVYKEAYQILKLSNKTLKQFGLHNGTMQLEQFEDETEESCSFVDFPVLYSPISEFEEYHNKKLSGKQKRNFLKKMLIEDTKFSTFTGVNEVCENDLNEIQTKKNDSVLRAKESTAESVTEPETSCVSTETSCQSVKKKKKPTRPKKKNKKRTMAIEMMQLLQDELLSNDQLCNLLTKEHLKLKWKENFGRNGFFVTQYLSDPLKKEIIIKAFEEKHGRKLDSEYVTSIVLKFEDRREKKRKWMNQRQNKSLDKDEFSCVDVSTEDEFKRPKIFGSDFKPVDADLYNEVRGNPLNALDYCRETRSVIAVGDANPWKDDDAKLILGQRLTSDNLAKTEFLIEQKVCENVPEKNLSFEEFGFSREQLLFAELSHSKHLENEAKKQYTSSKTFALNNCLVEQLSTEKMYLRSPKNNSAENSILSENSGCNFSEDKPMFEDIPDETDSFLQNDSISVVTNNKENFINNKRKLEIEGKTLAAEEKTESKRFKLELLEDMKIKSEFTRINCLEKDFLITSVADKKEKHVRPEKHFFTNNLICNIVSWNLLNFKLL